MELVNETEGHPSSQQICKVSAKVNPSNGKADETLFMNPAPSSRPYNEQQPYGQQLYEQPPPQYEQPLHGFSENDSFDGEEKYSTHFRDPNIRRKFIQKVYGILAVQLLFGFGIISIFVFSEKAKKAISDNPALLYLALVFEIAICLTLVCCKNVARKYPGNIILLSLYTFFSSIVAGFITAMYDTDVILIAAGLTVLIVSTVTIFSVSTRFDFTKYTGVLMVLTFALMLFGLVIAFLPYFLGDKTSISQSRLRVVYAGIAVVLFTLWLAWDTQVIVGGRKRELSPEDYVLGVLMLFMDIMEIFLNLLVLVKLME